jgi:site-specific DNA recombinase
MRAVIYARVSTEEQAEEGHSIDAQLRIVREFCAHRGWTIVGEYVDPGRSGRTLKRPRMQALIADAQLHLFDVVVVHKLDRLSRSLIDTLTLLSDLNKLGVS